MNASARSRMCMRLPLHFPMLVTMLDQAGRRPRRVWWHRGDGRATTCTAGYSWRHRAFAKRPTARRGVEEGAGDEHVVPERRAQLLWAGGRAHVAAVRQRPPRILGVADARMCERHSTCGVEGSDHGHAGRQQLWNGQIADGTTRVTRVRAALGALEQLSWRPVVVLEGRRRVAVSIRGGAGGRATVELAIRAARKVRRHAIHPRDVWHAAWPGRQRANERVGNRRHDSRGADVPPPNI